MRLSKGALFCARVDCRGGDYYTLVVLVAFVLKQHRERERETFGWTRTGLLNIEVERKTHVVLDLVLVVVVVVQPGSSEILAPPKR